MKNLLLILILVTFFGCQTNDQDIKIYTDRIDSLERVIIDKESDIEILHNEIELRESEISWLGHSLDSLKYNIKP
jgi:hypothetical protein